MEDLLQRLENKVKELVDQQHRLKHSNIQLHHSKSVIALEKDALLAKQLKAISQIEALVARLKALEKIS